MSNYLVSTFLEIMFTNYNILLSDTWLPLKKVTQYLVSVLLYFLVIMARKVYIYLMCNRVQLKPVLSVWEVLHFSVLPLNRLNQTKSANKFLWLHSLLSRDLSTDFILNFTT